MLEAHAYYVHTADHARLALAELRQPAAGPPTPGAPAFLLLHGVAQNRLAFTLGEIPHALVRHGGRVFVGELRGHGESHDADPHPETEWSLRAHLRSDVPALLKRVSELAEVERVHLVGHSMGGILGYAMLERSHRIASLTTFGAPVVLGVGRPLLRAAARYAAPVLSRVVPDRVPLDAFLRRVAPHASRPLARGPLGFVRDAIRLANPGEADPEAVAHILGNAHSVPKATLLSLAAIARDGRAIVDGTDIEAAVARSELPVAAVVGQRDVFGGRKSVEPILKGPGPRRIVTLDLAAHVDVTMGRHSGRVVAQLWTFLTGLPAPDPDRGA